ncbi:Hydrogenase maturation protein HypC [Desulfonispora thiosulfatigenes DSM 11270]|uniref:Hydrogenase maturation protein HypC n=1 Tax=Desulfonispora thiosulfatigenes DSM 11270 TaxID=656914 RepID=A0A1W1VH91_DESTI|nr:HypC/HybG/HupF family hydrogenase formation chaperone [Desulfonispora thiosulfatigenes]SMB92712.1 Hydrogenase maturation protein HypC [Desulfonispora thiosulfatigenes DSM 11270]
MCVAVPSKVISIEEPWAQVDLEGASYKINMSLTPDIEVGDYVIVHAGFSIQHLDPKEAEDTLKLWEEFYAHAQDE